MKKNRTAISGSRTQAIWSGSLQTVGRSSDTALAETTDAAQEFDGDNTQAAVVSAHAAGSRSTPGQVLDLMKKFQAESDDGYLTWTQAKQYFSCLPGSRELFLGGAYTGTERVEESGLV